MAVGFKPQLKRDSWMRHMCRGGAVIERLGTFLNMRMQTVQSDFEETRVALVVFRVFSLSARDNLVLRFCYKATASGGA